MMLNSIGNKISTARKKLNLSQADLAQKVSISSQAVGKWERGESMPDILTLNRLAEILGVDLNYFSDNFQSIENDDYTNQKLEIQPLEIQEIGSKKKFEWNWDMSKGNWTDADFSGLKDLKDKFSSSNIKNCKFIDSDLSALMLEKNNIELSDFTGSDLRDCKIRSSNLLNDQFKNCSFIDAEFMKDNIEKCDFSMANFSGAEIQEVNFENNIVKDVVWNYTMFKKSNLSHITFTGTLMDCHFEQCAFYSVKFENAIITNSFFKYNERFKKVQFINCKVDTLTFAFLKNNDANLNGVSLIT